MIFRSGRRGGRLEVSEDEVDRQAALVGLVDDECVVAARVGPAAARRHHRRSSPSRSSPAGPVGEPDLVADLVTEPTPSSSAARSATSGRRSGAAGCAIRANPSSRHLRQLGRLARSGLPRDDDDLVLRDGRGCPPGGDDRQVVRVAEQVGRAFQGGTGGPPTLSVGRGHQWMRRCRLAAGDAPRRTRGRPPQDGLRPRQGGVDHGWPPRGRGCP